ncbi:MAG: phosphatidate cytidylyltransferase [Paracoccus sp. (in: a-proteobacteria)]|nr:phosphatidate cytidylyltransferase [Paracoccus sp. (in: a-proteobacteria)]
MTGNWSDLNRRLVSAAILLAIGAVLAISTGVLLRLGIAVIVALTFWELARLTGWRYPDLHADPLGQHRPIALAVIAGVSLFLGLSFFPSMALLLLLVPVLAGLPGAVAKDRVSYALFGTAIMLVGYELVVLREAMGLHEILWIMGIVVLSDVLGYFVGRVVGGPKFWPSLSPKKTWSGTIAGWVAAAAFGLVLWLGGLAPFSVVILSPLICLAGQMGDIAESWLKRRAGVKDSSNLIPGHGGFMDRFDAVTGAVLAVFVLRMAGLLPQIGA